MWVHSSMTVTMAMLASPTLWFLKSKVELVLVLSKYAGQIMY